MTPLRLESWTSCTEGEHANRLTVQSLIGAKSFIAIIITVFMNTGQTGCLLKVWSTYSPRFTAYVSQLFHHGSSGTVQDMTESLEGCQKAIHRLIMLGSDVDTHFLMYTKHPTGFYLLSHVILFEN